MPSLDALLEDPKLAVQGALEACLTSCMKCQYGLATFGLDFDAAMKHTMIWTMMCAEHSPWIRAKSDPTYVASIRRDIARLTADLATIPAYDTIIERMHNGEDMLRREVINQERFDTRFAELEALLKRRTDMDEDIQYWKAIIAAATSTEFQENEDM